MRMLAWLAFFILFPCALLAAAKPASAQGAPAPSTRPPFIIAPMIEGLGYCQGGSGSATLAQALQTCFDIGSDSVALVKATLDQLEPGGPRGDVQVGYTVGINLLDLHFNGASQLKTLRHLIEHTGRPVVLYLMGNHFTASPRLPQASNDSYARFADQSVPKDNYFFGGVTPWTLDTDMAIQVNQLRFGALKLFGNWYAKLPRATQRRVVGITLAGELHQYFADFATGMGRYDNLRTTDYSPGSAAAFRQWLAKRYPRIEDLDRQMNASWTSLEQVTPPSLDIRRDKLEGLYQHLDGYAHGTLPVEGWLASLPPGHRLQIYLDGKPIGQAEYGLNRQDVYEAVKELPDPRVGFRYWLDFETLPRGIHTLQIAMQGPQFNYQIARREIVVMGSSQETPPRIEGEARLAAAPGKAPRAWLDRPRERQDYYFNPLAKAWVAFRADQVSEAYLQWFGRAVASGLPKEKLYSHQIAAATVGGWNPMLFASDASLTGPKPYRKGINLYGGSLDIALLKRHYLSGAEAFAVPEFHTQAWKNPGQSVKVLRAFQASGAVFMTPYFMSLVPEKFRGAGNPHDRFRIAPDNKDYGSNYLFSAIAEVARD